MVKSIYLQDGEEIFVDDEDYERVNQYTWHKYYSSNTRAIAIKNKKGNNIFLQNYIEPNSFQKIKNNDFTRKNLTKKGNAFRWKKAHFNNSSKYKGVSWNEKRKCWVSSISVCGKPKYLGGYKNEDEAAKVYNQAVLDFLDGESYLNIIGEDNRNKPRNYHTFKNQLIKSKKSYKGVSVSKRNYVTAKVNTPIGARYISSFETTEKAALAYNKCAIYLHGDNAILNDVPMTDELKDFIANWEIPDKIKALKEVGSND
ncbi:AP2 domain-containing protein [Staphylococcus saprophyticus]|uniref:AP2 domain-containing protein n=1 Tax=Staphylococcus saprophyticus TaxID=29385 RepID=UPI000CD25D02|nr:AP2 domain-containing protein [Staphylococcus saprophyticus]PNZ67698.1 AP2 domain-containing protein [Staphylococcus saprophyticus]